MKSERVIDACCTVNILATGVAVDIVRALDMTLLDTPQVAGEAITLSTPPDLDGNRNKQIASTEPLRQAGLLTTRVLDTDALVEAYVSAAARITDADASCIALAGVSNVPLLTDDKKERRIAQEMFPSIVLVSTLDVLAAAAAALSWSDATLEEVALSLYWCGNFAPPRHDPRSPWYQALLERALSKR